MVLVCLYSHSVFVCGLKNQGGAAAAEAIDKICDVVGTMGRLRSDGGSCFTCATFKKACERRRIQHLVVNRYSPFQNGAAERAVAGVKKIFRLFPEIVAQSGKQSRWFSLLGRSIRCLNDRPFSGSTPFEIFYERSRNHEEKLRYDGIPQLVVLLWLI
ncbi:hypothetical protein Pmar_PMAR019466 [Perkinsus marinus ATCC 50983]|uniref:Integrase catalytic domain-containing protein n=1 Tax=Perkinsus marinus (strain ATCC 50983 / TXsc) TaxID=423536 RepID=C5KW67_PERM5|nr:hypothetical protein Pmar_PMAR019466 [Perkinsus marinus ATCC 50983]EER11277.1 hypothetical protein Pmar_PMAR019466 [Perkinsus marinus ATCC 50983]|eukprot:XP_002779482.1 hypothetical protein Pmar_PMAR019466 [Perkinsus marinus ATCC 50983]